MRLHGDNLRRWPVLMAEYRKAADVGSDVHDRADFVLAQGRDLVLVLKDRVGMLDTGRLDVKVAAERLVANSKWFHGSLRGYAVRIVSSMGMRSCSSQWPRQM